MVEGLGMWFSCLNCERPPWYLIPNSRAGQWYIRREIGREDGETIPQCIALGTQQHCCPEWSSSSMFLLSPGMVDGTQFTYGQ